MHTPVLLKDAVDGLDVKSGGLYIDATAGEGGHLLEIAKRGGRVLGIDRDEKQIERLALNVERLKNISLVQGNFADIEKIARDKGFFPADGILFDLGLSMEQIENSGKGFSYKKLRDPLDMRFDQKTQMKAEDIIKSSDKNQLYEILAKYGEEIRSMAISQTLVRARSVKPITEVGDLIRVIDEAIGKKDTKAYARVFQALRIAVNDEFENVKKALRGSVHILSERGRIVTITFHSLEDRIVKQFIREERLKQLNKKVAIANPRRFERSAKLRIMSR
jgi:16S rRNA (cytosine1402-N4)-methyltransferase